MSAFDRLLAAGPATGTLPGVAVGVVTSNADPQHLGRVKVRFPALSGTDESTWAGVVTPMAGPERGLYLVPEEGDTVLVAFEQGDVNRPFVLGGFWAGPQKPPPGKEEGNDIRQLRSRSGHVVRLDDTQDAARIEIVDGSGKNSITIDTATNTITVAADGDLRLTAKGKLELKGREVSVTAEQKLSLAAEQSAELTSTGPLKLQGATVDIN